MDLHSSILIIYFKTLKGKKIKEPEFKYISVILDGMSRIVKYPETFIILWLIYSKCLKWFVIKCHLFNLKGFLILCHLKTLCENVYSDCNRSNSSYGYPGYMRKNWYWAVMYMKERLNIATENLKRC